MTIYIRVLLYSASLALAQFAFAQTRPDIQATTQVVTLPPGSIEGRLHPEQIPDKTAYRLFFRAFSEGPDATPDEKLRQQVKLGAIGLDNGDAATAVDILAEHHLQYANNIRDYESVLQSAQLRKIDHAGYAAKRDAIVENTLLQFRARLSPEGFFKLEQFVKHEKVHMTIVPNPAMY